MRVDGLNVTLYYIVSFMKWCLNITPVKSIIFFFFFIYYRDIKPKINWLVFPRRKKREYHSDRKRKWRTWDHDLALRTAYTIPKTTWNRRMDIRCWTGNHTRMNSNWNQRMETTGVGLEPADRGGYKFATTLSFFSFYWVHFPSFRVSKIN